MMEILLDDNSVPEHILKHRAAVEKWKRGNRAYYLAQKRALSARPEYKERRRQRYREQREALIAEGLAPRKRGRPSLYDGEEAVEARRRTNREATARYRLKKVSQSEEKDEQSTSEDSSEISA